MQRPTRILIFGILCLLVGVLSGMKNTMELGLTLAGPTGLEQFMRLAEQQQGLPPSSQMSLKAEIAAQRKPVYRGLQGLESAASSVMAVVLMVAGIGLLRDRAWSLKLARYWAYYAFPAAAVSVVLSVRYVLPEVPDASVGGGMVNGAFMLLMLWAYPFLLLRQLPTAAVKAYLDARQHQRQYPGPSSAYPVASRPTQASSSRADAPPPASSPSLHRSNHSTWRDDPWNDPSSQ